MFAAAVVSLIAKVPLLVHPTMVTAGDLTEIITSGIVIAASATSFINRFKKGDVTLIGARVSKNG